MIQEQALLQLHYAHSEECLADITALALRLTSVCGLILSPFCCTGIFFVRFSTLKATEHSEENLSPFSTVLL